MFSDLLFVHIREDSEALNNFKLVNSHVNLQPQTNAVSVRDDVAAKLARLYYTYVICFGPYVTHNACMSCHSQSSIFSVLYSIPVDRSELFSSAS